MLRVSRLCTYLSSDGVVTKLFQIRHNVPANKHTHHLESKLLDTSSLFPWDSHEIEDGAIWCTQWVFKWLQ